MRDYLALAADICIIVFALPVWLKGWAAGRIKANAKMQKATDTIDIPPSHKFNPPANKDDIH